MSVIDLRAAGAPCPAGAPDELAARLRALLAAGAPPAPKGGNRFDLADHRDAVQRHADEVAAVRERLVDAFASPRGWSVTTVPLAIKELVRRSAGGTWHRPPREWASAFRHRAFFRDEARRAAAMVAHPLVEGSDRAAIDAWAAAHDLVATFPDYPSWQDPDGAFLAVFEPAEPVPAPAPAPTAPPMPAQARGVDTPVEPSLDTPAARAPAARSVEEIEMPAMPDDIEHPDPAPPTVPDHHEMRPVAPVDLDGAAPRDLSGEVGPDFDIVAPTDLLVDEQYQRGLSPKSLALIRRIVRTWSWAKFKPPVTVRVGDRLHVIDGQHTAIAAASHGGIPVIPVVVVTVPELSDRAAAFVSHATDRVQATPIQVHHAAVLAGDETATTIANVCRNAGVTLLPFASSSGEYRAGETVALAGIRRLVDRRGAMRARQILEALVHADLAPITGDHLRIGEALLCDADYAGEFDPERLTAAMRGLNAKAHAEARELSIAKRIPTWRALVAVLYRGRKARPKGTRRSDHQVDGTEEAAA